MSSTPEVVVFDLGGVLVELDESWPTHAGLDPWEVREWLAHSADFHAFERGELSEARYLRALGDAFGQSDHQRLREATANWVRGRYPGAPELLASIPIPCAALSNTNRIHWSIFDPDRALRSRLGPALASHHLGARKPERAAFERATSILGTSAVLFLDDSEENVRAAGQFGWAAERVEGPVGARAALEAAGIPLPSSQRGDGA